MIQEDPVNGTHNTEELVLASLFWETDPATINEVRRLVTAESFEDANARAIYGAMCEILDRGEDVDHDLLALELEGAGTLERVGGRPYLALLTATDSPVLQAPALARRLHADETRRKVVEAAQGGGSSVEVAERVSEVLRKRQDGLRAGTRSAAISLAQALADSERNRDDRPCVERFVWPGRVTLFAAREKSGKSTTVAGAMAAKSAGFKFLGRGHEAGRVLYWFGSKEGHVSDVAKVLAQFGADPERLYLLPEGPEPFLDLEDAVSQVKPEVVVVDTLSAFVGGLEMESNDRRWDNIMGRFARLARESGAGIMILHHANKGDGKYRDSTAIGAGVDVLLEMHEGEVEGVRRFDASPRIGIELDDFSVRLIEGQDGLPPYFELAPDSLSVDMRVTLFVENNPGCSKNQLRRGVKAKASEVDAAVFRCLGKTIENQGTDHRFELHPVSRENRKDTHRDTVQTRSGHGTSLEQGVSVSPGGHTPYGGAPGTRTPDTEEAA